VGNVHLPTGEDAAVSQVDKIDAERYRALREFRLEWFPYLFFKPPLFNGKYAIKIPSNDEEADESVDQMIERFKGYEKDKPR